MTTLQKILAAAIATGGVGAALIPAAVASPPTGTQCAPQPTACLELSLAAMGGAGRLLPLKSTRIEAVQHTLLVEQSYRQEPFITAYTRLKQETDYVGQRLRSEAHLTWPESDPGQSESDATLVAGPEGGINRSAGRDTPANPADVAAARYSLALGPLTVLRTASQAKDLHYGPPEWLRSTLHPVLIFNWDGQPVRILINPFNHLPDAVERVATFSDHWYQWGDVKQRFYFDDWQILHGIVYPTNQIEERNGVLWQSTQVVALAINVPVDDADFKMDAEAALQSAQSQAWESPFKAKERIALAPGIALLPGSWNTTVVKQDDGLVVLEAPRSGIYLDGIIRDAKEHNPGERIKAVLSTSDSWPHIGGVRQAVALELPVYILDLNRPLLDRLIASPHRLNPDLLAQSTREPRWKVVSGKVQVGAGPNRMELYPLRGAATERQYMVYFPEHHLLYASDTLALNDDGSLYDPELMREVIEAVQREKLQVTTVFAMHQAPVPWSEAVSLVAKATTG